jgi:leucyl/phenylalanyl-tRNA--protein transferase
MTTAPLYSIARNRMVTDFPATSEALDEPDGLLAAGGDLSQERLLRAYRRGIFPWYSTGQPILWWAPNPRSVLFPDDLNISRSLRRTLAKGSFTVTTDRAFARVIRACAEPRKDSNGTWLTNEMVAAYIALHHAGHAHSVECWCDEQLAGGLYGVAIGCVFFGESMFTRVSGASKVALVELVARLRSWSYRLIDCQVHNAHLAGLGASLIERERFNALIAQWCAEPPAPSAWRQTH